MPTSAESFSTSQAEAYARGFQLFNQAAFWHAHEQWEICWHAATGAERHLYQGLIQTAAALVHWQRGNLRGLHLNWNKAREHLAIGMTLSWPLDLLKLTSDMDAFVAQHGVGNPPILTLIQQ